eukprot:SAG31_NODE_418_length_15893_cov_5.433899_16_plen_82_part_00
MAPTPVLSAEAVIERLKAFQLDGADGKDCFFLVFVQLFEKYGALIEINAALIEKVSPCSERLLLITSRWHRHRSCSDADTC